MRSPRTKLCSCLMLFGAAGGVVFARPPSGAAIPIKPFSMQLTETYLQTDVDMFHEEQQTSSTGMSTTRDRIIIQPALGLGFEGAFYHPDLLHYRLGTELGVDWQSSRVDAQSSDSSSFLQRYHLSLDILRTKPYTVSVFADKDFSYRDYDFFSRVRVDSTRYGARAGYTAGPVPFSISYTHYDEQVTESARPTKTAQEMINFTASNSRRDDRAHTQLFYNLNEYTREDSGFSAERGLSQNISLSDNENFGRKDWVRLMSLFNYDSLTEIAQPSQRMFLHENLRLQHTPRFLSLYDYGYDFSSSGDAESTTQNGRVGASYQLYKNLASAFDVHYQLSKSRSPGNSLDIQRYGVALSEQYTRHLGSWGNLTLGYSGSLDHEKRDATGTELKIINESHTLIEGILTLLNQPGVNLSSIQVTDSTGTIPYHELLDYRILPHGSFTEIQPVISSGSAITNGTVVLVTYTAAQQPSAAYSSMNNGLNFRIDFWSGRLGLYGRWTKLDYYGGEELVLDTMDTKLIGIDTSWRWFRAGLEYEVADSRFTPYNRTHAFQTANFQPATDTLLGVDCDENWIKHRDTDQNQAIYSIIGRYQQQVWMSLAWRLEGGILIERGGGYDRDMLTARAGLDWEVGKVMLKLGYEFNNENYSTDQRTRHYFFMRARRDFL